MRRVAILVTVAACWTSTPATTTPRESEAAPSPSAIRKAFHPSPDHLSCGPVVDGALAKANAELAQAGLGAAVLDQLRDALIASCTETQWTTELLGCYDAAEAVRDFDRCEPLMTQAQKDDVIKRMTPIYSQIGPSIPTTPTP